MDAPLLILDLGFHIVDGVGRLHLKGDCLARKGLDENLTFKLNQNQGIVTSWKADLHI